jgi:septum formation inhibitor-activating ATPase MinD
MARERFVILGVARARSLWFRAVAQWATSAAIPAEFIKCVSAEEVRAHFSSGRAFSAALVDAGLPTVDRDLIAAARETGCPVLVVDDGRTGRDWRALGAATVLPAGFDREQLLDALATHTLMVGGGDTQVGAEVPLAVEERLGRVVAVCGPGGTGASTAAVALAQQLGTDPKGEGPVVLADLALRAEQAMLHDARDIVPGVQELVEAHRGRRPTAEEVRALTFDVAGRNYHLLLGLRRARYWSTVRPRSFEAAFDSLRSAFGTVVCDVTADFEGEEDGGSIDVEERNVMARTAVQRADAVVVVGTAGVKGLHALVRVIGELLDAGVSATRIVPVLNLAPRNPKARAELAAALGQLTALPAGAAAALPSPVFLPQRRVESALRDGAPLPAPLGPLLAGAVRATFARNPRRAGTSLDAPQLVAPGTVGTWHDGDDEPMVGHD